MTSLWDAVFNPSTLPRFFHTVDATLIVASFFMGGIAARLLLKNKKVEMAKKSLRLAIVIGLIASVLQVVPFGNEGGELMDLNAVWFFLILGLISGYAILDGFDLGVGVLHLFARDNSERRINIGLDSRLRGNDDFLRAHHHSLMQGLPKPSA